MWKTINSSECIADLAGRDNTACDLEAIGHCAGGGCHFLGHHLGVVIGEVGGAETN